jgi:hypothetical protein
VIIEVELYDGVYVKVPRSGLDRLLERKLAKRFRRSSGWVTVGVNPVRSTNPAVNGYNGFERRHSYSRVAN